LRFAQRPSSDRHGIVSVEDSAKLIIRPPKPAEVGVFQLADARAHDRRELRERDPAVLDRQVTKVCRIVFTGL
jgi:hypothetical protein